MVDVTAKTYYDVLGVPPDASQTKLKQAYIRLAQLHHPDRQGESSPAARQQADARIREINRAWEAVRTPDRRAEYDRSLRGPGPAWEKQTASGGTRAPRTSPVRPGDDGPGPQASGYVVPESHSAFWRFGPVMFLGLVLIGILIFTAYANQPSDGGPDPTIPSRATPFRAGSCVVLASTGGRATPLMASCQSPGAIEVRSVTDLGRPCGPGLIPFDISDEKVRLCLVE